MKEGVMKSVVVFLAEGFEEIEAVTPIDLLRRAGLNVFVAGVEGVQVMGGHGLLLQADGTLADIPSKVDAVVIPGGRPGADNIGDSSEALNLIRTVFSNGGLVASICASPGLVLSKVPVLNHRKATCYPGFQEYFPDDSTYLEEPVVVDGNLITSRGPGTAGLFSLEIVRYLVDDSTADSLAAATLIE